MSSRDLFPRSISQRAQEQAGGWVLGTSPRMTICGGVGWRRGVGAQPIQLSSSDLFRGPIFQLVRPGGIDAQCGNVFRLWTFRPVDGWVLGTSPRMTICGGFSYRQQTYPPPHDPPRYCSSTCSLRGWRELVAHASAMRALYLRISDATGAVDVCP